MPRTQRGASESAPEPPSGALLASYTPTVAHYAPGPFLDEQIVTPTEVKWMNARTYIVRNRTDRQDYRAIRVYDQSRQFVGYWAIELLPPELDFGRYFQADVEDMIEDYEKERVQNARDRKRTRLRGKDA